MAGRAREGSLPFSTPSGRGSQRDAYLQNRRQADESGHGPEEGDYHFHQNALGLFESYFADSPQYHCNFSTRNNPGILLPDSPEQSEPDSSDSDNTTVLDQDNDDLPEAGVGKVPVHFVQSTQSESKVGSTSTEDGDLYGDLRGANRCFGLCTTDSDILKKNKARKETCGPAESASQAKKPSYIVDDDLFKERWFPDLWDRPPGQMWTKEVQNELNLRAATKGRSFTGARARWLFNQIHKRKGSRFPFKERSSLKRPGQTHGEYLLALKRRREEEKSYENQVKEYDEDMALEDCKWTIHLYDMVYGPEWPDNIKQETYAPSDTEQRSDADYASEEIESVAIRPTTRGHRRSQGTKGDIDMSMKGISVPDASQRASAEEIEKSNAEFRDFKAKKMEAARIERENADVREFMLAGDYRTFSNGYRESWREMNVPAKP